MRWITFDCYGTLVDWRTGISQVIESIAPGQVEQILPLYYRHEAAVQRERYRPYRTVLALALDHACAEAGIAAPPEAGNRLAEQLPDWPVFPDVEPALRTLHDDGWKLGVLSNIDRDLFEGTRSHLPITIDAVITAEDVRSYKPAPGHFDEFRKRYTPTPHVHTAQSYYHDITPAHQLGIPTVWINRLSEEQAGSIASAVLPDLRRLPETARRLCP